MIQKIIKIGNSAGIILPQAILKSKGIHEGDEVKVQITKITKDEKKVDIELSARDKKIIQLTKSFVEHYRKDLEDLAQK